MVKENSELKNRNTVLRKESIRKSSMIHSLENSKISSDTQRHTDVETSYRYKELEIQVSSMKVQIDHLKKNIASNEAKIAEDERLLSSREMNVSQLQVKLDSVHEIKESLQESNNVMALEIARLKTELESARKEITHHKAVPVKTDGFDLRDKRLSELEFANNSLDHNTKTLTAKLHETQRALESSTRQCSELKKHIHKLQSESIAAQNLRINETEKRADFEHSSRVYLQKIRKMTSRIAELERIIFECEKKSLIRAPVRVTDLIPRGFSEGDPRTPPSETVLEL
jgi:chromosome segregation ATPase